MQDIQTRSFLSFFYPSYSYFSVPEGLPSNIQYLRLALMIQIDNQSLTKKRKA